MQLLTLHDTRTGAIARILPDVGFNCFQFQTPVAGQTIDVLDAMPDFAATGEQPSHSGIPLLFPYPNRIRGGRFRWGNRDYHLTGVRDDRQGNAIHGLVIDRPWRVVSSGATIAVGQFQLSVDAPDRRGVWPADFLIEVRYELRGATLRCDIRIVNPDTVPLPWGFGTHPYFKVPLSPQSKTADCLVQAPAAELWELENCLPTGKRAPVSAARDLREGKSLAGLKLDDVLTGVKPRQGVIESVVMDAKAGWQVSQVTDAIFRELVVYTPPHGRSVCLEPYTCVTDAVNLQAQGLDAGWRVLPPGGEFRTWIEIRASQVIA